MENALFSAPAILAPVTFPAHQILPDVFGYDEFRGQQLAAIEAVLAMREWLGDVPLSLSCL
ncbi:MAG: hypothetical protein JSV45_14095 [Chromatiales bacterium]|nr:MAG: hypothetical protein JSV45_14095 [Chromatiales bacterium]